MMRELIASGREQGVIRGELIAQWVGSRGE